MRLQRITAGPLLVLLLATPVLATESTEEVPARPIPVPEHQIDAWTIPAFDAEWAQAAQREADALVQSHLAASAALAARAKDAVGADRITLMKQAEESGEQLVLDVLGIHARYARQAGELALAEKIEASIRERVEARENPSSRIQPLATPVVRSATGEGGSR